jgi:hypothetical protein
MSLIVWEDIRTDYAGILGSIVQLLLVVIVGGIIWPITWAAALVIVIFRIWSWAAKCLN